VTGGPDAARLLTVTARSARTTDVDLPTDADPATGGDPPTDRRPASEGDGAVVGPRDGADHHRVVIIGAGFSGIGLAVRLQAEGVDDVVILEKEDDLGGTWYVNTYPGCQCDVPSLLYSLSFQPNTEWTRTFAPQPEIEEYLRTVAERTNVKRLIRFNAEVTGARWDAAARRWRVTTAEGEVTADLCVMASGFLSTPSSPSIPGLDRFGGAVFHSARWDHDHDLSGERVAVIGTGASAIQFVPQIAPRVGHLAVFQRTPPWVMPRPDRAFTPRERWLFRHSPLAMRISRARIYWTRELMVVMFAKQPRLAKLASAGARKHLEEQVADAGLRARLTPDYALGCKRVLLSNDYYPALTQPHVELVTDPISEVTADAVVTRDGSEHRVDTIILGTGFAVTEPPMAEHVHGADGRSLAEHWAGSPSAYLGTTLAGFPNLFVMVGPNTGLGHSSMVFMMECQYNYVVDALKTMAARSVDSFSVDPDAVEAFNDEIQAKLARTVWNSGCSSWYLDGTGRNTTLWPDFTWRYRQRTRRFDAERYSLTRSS
jgi:cation diffusion facilitator CzcD-associated flavoprotein CzcO